MRLAPARATGPASRRDGDPRTFSDLADHEHLRSRPTEPARGCCSNPGNGDQRLAEFAPVAADGAGRSDGGIVLDPRSGGGTDDTVARLPAAYPEPPVSSDANRQLLARPAAEVL